MQNNFAEMVTGWPTKIAIANKFDMSKSIEARGNGQFPYIHTQETLKVFSSETNCQN